MNDVSIRTKAHLLPQDIPVFPLPGVMLLPRGHLPLNIFEPRYIAMVNDALRTDRVIGMIQPREVEGEALFSTGCAGRITSFHESEDGRYEITLTGLARFAIRMELPPTIGGYRRIRADWEQYKGDTNPVALFDLDRARLKDLLGNYFNMQNMDCDLDSLDHVSDDNLITCLAMVCPLDANEKQALLEAAGGRERSELFMTLLDMAVRDTARERPERYIRH